MATTTELDVKNRKILSETIGAIRFPLMIFVVLAHIYIPDQTSNLLVNSFDTYVIEAFIRIPVPLFFFISGFLFFYRLDNFGCIEYYDKLKKRTMRLLVPYLFWGVLAIGVKYIHYSFGDDEFVYLFNDGYLKWLYFVVWEPINYQLWFVRDLFVLTLISPIIYFLLRKVKFLFVLMLGGAWLFWHKNIFAIFDLEYIIVTGNVFDVNGFNFLSLFFFSFGAWFSIFDKNFMLKFERLFPMCCVLYVGCYIYHFICSSLYFAEVFRRMAILFGLISVLVIVYKLVEKGTIKRNIFLENGSQFIYYYHALFLMNLNILLFKFILPPSGSDCLFFFVYLLIPVVTILVGLWLYRWGMKYIPRVLNFVLGIK